MKIFFLFPFLCFAQNILLYSDKGTDPNCLRHTIYTLNQRLPHYQVKKVTAKQIIEEDWEKDTALLIMPGGANLPYKKALQGKGNAKIKKYVEDGGSYLGICAGGYYGGSYISFAKGSEIEVAEKRELAFFPGTVEGPTFEGFDYRSNKGAKAPLIHPIEGSAFHSFYYGGGHFLLENKLPKVDVLAYYENGKAAIVRCRIGKGCAILTGVHIEYDPDIFKDPHFKKLIPPLKESENQRKLYQKKIFSLLGLDT